MFTGQKVSDINRLSFKSCTVLDMYLPYGENNNHLFSHMRFIFRYFIS
jgi:hypothetical protein